MGGRIWLESEAGKGTTFHFTAAFGAVAEPPASLVVPAAPRELPMVALRILVADDNAVNRSVAAGILQKQGHRISFATDGCEAVAAAKREQFDVILMDVQMPELNGFDATSRIREFERALGRYTPIIAMTAHAGSDDRAQCLGAGMDEYVAKPVSKEKLREAIEKSLGAITVGGGEAAILPVSSSFDAAHLLAQLEGDAEMFQRIANIFRESTPPLLENLQKALHTKNASAAARAAHTLAGSLGNIGATRAATIARELEAQLAKNPASETESCFNNLHDEIDLVLAELGRTHFGAAISPHA